MEVTVAICTWNRSELLARALASLAAQRVPPGTSWEVVVVNNNCSDDTDAVVSSFGSRLPIRALHEKTPGLSSARNRALEEAAGDYILWTDDDVKVSADWLSAYLSAFRRFPQYAVFGGPIRPDFEGTPPGWLTTAWRQVEIAYAIRDFGPEDSDLSLEENRIPFGANFAIRADLQRAHPYDPALGRAPESRFRGGEETAVIGSILSSGWRGRWVPEAVVLHWLPKSRQSLKYIRNHWRGWGMSEAGGRQFASHPALFGIPRWILRVRLAHELRYRYGRLFLTPERWIDELKAASYWAGISSHFRRLATSKR